MRFGLVGLLGQWDPSVYTVEDLGVGMVRFDNGATLTLEASFAANIEKDVFSAEILGTEGGCTTHPPRMFFERNQTLVDATPAFLPAARMHEAEIRAFVQAVRNDTEVVVTGEQGLMVTEILDAIYRSAEEGREVSLE